MRKLRLLATRLALTSIAAFCLLGGTAHAPAPRASAGEEPPAGVACNESDCEYNCMEACGPSCRSAGACGAFECECQCYDCGGLL